MTERILKRYNPIYNRNILDIYKDKVNDVQQTIDEIRKAILPGPGGHIFMGNGKKVSSLFIEAKRLKYLVGDKWFIALILKHFNWEDFIDFLKENNRTDFSIQECIDFLLFKRNIHATDNYFTE